VHITWRLRKGTVREFANLFPNSEIGDELFAEKGFCVRPTVGLSIVEENWNWLLKGPSFCCDISHQPRRRVLLTWMFDDQLGTKSSQGRRRRLTSEQVEWRLTLLLG
jgi:hypothetical protein